MKFIDGTPVYDSRQTALLGIENGVGKIENGAKSSKSVYEIITEKVIALIESSEKLPWQQSWKVAKDGNPNLPQNFKSKENYRGFNVFFLSMMMHFKKSENPYFLTFKQITDLKGRLKKGSTAMSVVYYQKFEYAKTATNVDPKDKDFSFVLKYYNVFHGDDIEGIDFKLENIQAYEKPANLQIESCENILAKAPNMPRVQMFGNDAKYSVKTFTDGRIEEEIFVPKIENFTTPQEFYSTLFHELIHATGSPHRLDREDKKKRQKWGDSFYAFEELVAEMGASYLCAEAGVLYFTLNNSASYIQSWKSKVVNYLKDEPKFFLRACSEAQKGADYILNRLDKAVYAKYNGLTVVNQLLTVASTQRPINRELSLKIAIAKAKIKIALL